MREAVVVSTARTPVGRAYRGAFNDTQAQDLAGRAIAAAVERAGIDPSDVDEVVVGSAMQEGTTGYNVGRQAALRAGLPVTVPGMSVDRQCASGLMAVATAAKEIIVDGLQIAVGGGVESISLVQNEHRNTYRAADPWLKDNGHDIYISMLETAENVAERFGVSRETQDSYALESQRRTAAAQDAGLFDDEIIPVEATRLIADKNGSTSTEQVTLRLDEGNRPSTTADGLAKLTAVLPGRAGHEATITAGTASELSDGAAAVVLMEKDEAARRGRLRAG